MYFVAMSVIGLSRLLLQLILMFLQLQVVCGLLLHVLAIPQEQEIL